MLKKNKIENKYLHNHCMCEGEKSNINITLPTSFSFMLRHAIADIQ